MSSSQNIDLQRDCAAGVYLFEAQNPIPHPLTTVYVFTVLYIYSYREGGRGRVEPERKLEGHSSQLVRKYHHD
jgi:hypothetical protein